MNFEYLKPGASFWYFNGKERRKVVIAEYDYDIGITVVRASDKDHYIICSNGPTTKVSDTYSEEAYILILEEIEYCIKEKKVFDAIKFMNKHAERDYGNSPSGDDCPFNR